MGTASVPASLCGRAACFVQAGWKFQTNDFVLFTAFISPSLFGGWLYLQAKITGFAAGSGSPGTLQLQGSRPAVGEWGMRRSRVNLVILGCKSCDFRVSSVLVCQTTLLQTVVVFYGSVAASLLSTLSSQVMLSAFDKTSNSKCSCAALLDRSLRTEAEGGWSCRGPEGERDSG